MPPLARASRKISFPFFEDNEIRDSGSGLLWKVLLGLVAKLVEMVLIDRGKPYDERRLLMLVQDAVDKSVNVLRIPQNTRSCSPLFG